MFPKVGQERGVVEVFVLFLRYIVQNQMFRFPQLYFGSCAVGVSWARPLPARSKFYGGRQIP